jgi:hypothetical protein
MSNSSAITPIFEERDKIADARNYPEFKKVKEFTDDHGYSGSMNAFIGVITGILGYNYLVFGLDKGPQKPDQITNQYNWKRSGKTEEKGHEGGGNTQNIYGHDSNEVYIASELEDNSGYLCATLFTKYIHEMVMNGDEANYNDNRQRDCCVHNTRFYDNRDMKRKKPWIMNVIDYVKKKTSMPLTYFQIFEMNTLPSVYTVPSEWTAFKQQFGMLHYSIEIQFLNEFLNETKPSPMELIDTIGIKGKKTNERHMVICKNTEDKEYYMEYRGILINIKNPKKILTLTDDQTLYTPVLKLHTFIADKTYITKQQKILSVSYTAEDFYGIYHIMNGRFVYGLPEGVLGASKNNHLAPGGGNTAYFRVVTEPHEDAPKEELKKVLKTRTIKADTKLQEDTFPVTECIDLLKDIQRGKIKIENEPVSQERIPPPSVVIETITGGGSKQVKKRPVKGKKGYGLLYVGDNNLLAFETKNKKYIASHTNKILNKLKCETHGRAIISNGIWTNKDVFKIIKSILSAENIKVNENKKLKGFGCKHIQFTCENTNKMMEIANKIEKNI